MDTIILLIAAAAIFGFPICFSLLRKHSPNSTEKKPNEEKKKSNSERT